MKKVFGIHKCGEKSINYAGLRANFPTLNIDTFPIFCDSNGKMWSEHLSEFDTSTLKILVSEDGMINSYSYDVTAIGIPVVGKFSVIEISQSELPQNFFKTEYFTNWSWSECNGIQVRTLDDEERVLLNSEKKKSMMADIISEITKLQILEKYNVMSFSDSTRLEILELALIQLNNIDCYSDNIVWPEI